MNMPLRQGQGLLGHEDRFRIPAGACAQDRSDPRGECGGERQARPAERGHLRRAETAAHVAHLRRRGDRRRAALADPGARADRGHHLSQRLAPAGYRWCTPASARCRRRSCPTRAIARLYAPGTENRFSGQGTPTGHAEEGRRRLSAERQVVLRERHLSRHLHPHARRFSTTAPGSRPRTRTAT